MKIILRYQTWDNNVEKQRAGTEAENFGAGSRSP